MDPRRLIHINKIMESYFLKAPHLSMTFVLKHQNFTRPAFKCRSFEEKDGVEALICEDLKSYNSTYIVSKSGSVVLNKCSMNDIEILSLIKILETEKFLHKRKM